MLTGLRVAVINTAAQVCGPSPVGMSPSVGHTPGHSPLLDVASLVIGMSTIVLFVAVVVALVMRRRRVAHNGSWFTALAVGSLIFAALVLAWIWQLCTSYTGGCAISVNSAPFSEVQAMRLVPFLVVAIAALTALWIALASRFALRRPAAL